MVDKRIVVAKIATSVLAAASVALVGVTGAAQADEVKGKWRFDLQLGGVSPGGKIESKSGNVTTVTGLEQPAFIEDPRSDANTLEYASHRGSGRIEFHASYGLAAFRRSELIIDLGVGYQKSKVRNLELSYSFDASDPSANTAGLAYARPGCETELARAAGNQQTGDILAGCTWFSERLFTQFPGTFLTPTRVERPDDRLQGSSLTNFLTENFDGGDLTSYPISVSLLLRFRPTKRFNPYAGAGLGYQVNDFKESARFTEFADQMAGSLVTNVNGPVSEADLGARDLDDVSIVVTDANEDGTQEIRATALGHRMVRPRIDAPNSFYGQLRGGAEYQFARRWTVFGEARFDWMDKDVTITADGREQFGSATPQLNELNILVDGEPNPLLFPVGGRPAYVIDGGLRQAAYDPITGALINNGELGQPGEYYFDGGKLKLSGWSFTAGIRFTL